MEITELSLAPTSHYFSIEKSGKSTTTSSSESENGSRKRKLLLSESESESHHHNHHPLFGSSCGPPKTLPSVGHPPSFEWEQCLDLETGNMYYKNKKTVWKPWNGPRIKEQKLDLELNMSTNTNATSGHHQNYINATNASPISLEDSKKQKPTSNNNNSSSMVALACLNCHLLVILSRSSPSCPNCKFVHSLQSTTSSSPQVQQNPTKILSPTKSLQTLSLLN